MGTALTVLARGLLGSALLDPFEPFTSGVASLSGLLRGLSSELFELFLLLLLDSLSLPSLSLWW